MCCRYKFTKVLQAIQSWKQLTDRDSTQRTSRMADPQWMSVERPSFRFGREENRTNSHTKFSGQQQLAPNSGCVGMGILQHTDNDSISKPDAQGAQVFDTEQQPSPYRPISTEELRERFPAVFTEKIGNWLASTPSRSTSLSGQSCTHPGGYQQQQGRSFI